jgi:chromosome segregation ATPase
LTRQKAASDAAAKDSSAQYGSVASQLNDANVRASNLAEMVQAAEAARQAGVKEVENSRVRIADLQKQIDARTASLKSLEADKASLSTQVADANKKVTELAQKKNAAEQSQNAAKEEISAMKKTLAASEKAMADSRATLLQQMGASRAEVEAALTRLQQIASSVGKGPDSANKQSPESTPAPQQQQQQAQSPQSAPAEAPPAQSRR